MRENASVITQKGNPLEFFEDDKVEAFSRGERGAEDAADNKERSRHFSLPAFLFSHAKLRALGLLLLDGQTDRHGRLDGRTDGRAESCQPPLLGWLPGTGRETVGGENAMLPGTFGSRWEEKVPNCPARAGRR